MKQKIAWRGSRLTVLTGVAMVSFVPGFLNAGPAGELPPVTLAQAMVPPTGMGDADKPMPMDERMNRRFPRPVRVDFLIGLPVLDDSSSTIGFVRYVVRTRQDKIALIVSYGGWFGFGARPVAVPVDAVGMMGRQVASLDMAPNEYAAAPTWAGRGDTVLPNEDSIRVGLARR